MNLTVRTKNFLEFNFISTVFFYLLFTQFFINSTQLNIGIWQDESPYSFTTNTIALARITSANTLERIGNNLKNSFQEVAINTVASSASQSAINGNSFTDSLKSQGENILIYTLAKVGANEIGRAYHGTTTLDANGNVIDKTPPTIVKSEQLLLHAGLGAITSSLTGNDAMSGAIAGVAGELTAELANENGADVATSIQLANLSGAISSVIYGGLTNQSDEEMANNAWEGSRIGGNAGANNATYVDKNGMVLRVMKKEKDGTTDLGVYIDKQDGGTDKDQPIGHTEYWDEFIIPESGNVATKAQIHFDKSIDADIQKLSNEGGGQVGGWNSSLERAKLAYDSLPGGKFDIKAQKEIYGRPFDGYLLNDNYATIRSAGNYLAGLNAAKAGASWQDTIWASGILQSPIMLNRSAPYYGELPYAGRRIEAGFNSISKNNDNQ